jgi:UDP-3-O-[3-hydroxymyristoyl] glucosamine N-acyltransferase
MPRDYKGNKLGPRSRRPGFFPRPAMRSSSRIVIGLSPRSSSDFVPAPCRPAAGISPAAMVHPTAKLGANVTVYPHAHIDADVIIGDGTIVHSGVSIWPVRESARTARCFRTWCCTKGTRVGNRVIIHANASIGAYGFGYSTQQGRHQLSAQLGYVELQDDVEIGACTTIDRGTYDATVIGEGTKIDNQVMVAHNCRIGKHNLLCSQVGIAGSSSTGDYVVMAGQVGIRDHVHIGTGARDRSQGRCPRRHSRQGEVSRNSSHSGKAAAVDTDESGQASPTSEAGTRHRASAGRVDGRTSPIGKSSRRGLNWLTAKVLVVPPQR